MFLCVVVFFPSVARLLFWALRFNNLFLDNKILDYTSIEFICLTRTFIYRFVYNSLGEFTFVVWCNVSTVLNWNNIEILMISKSTELWLFLYLLRNLLNRCYKPSYHPFGIWQITWKYPKIFYFFWFNEMMINFLLFGFCCF